MLNRLLEFSVRQRVFVLLATLVLVGIGVGLVHARGLVERLPSRLPARSVGRSIGRLVPAGSAAVMLLAGVLITAQAALTLR